MVVVIQKIHCNSIFKKKHFFKHFYILYIKITAIKHTINKFNNDLDPNVRPILRPLELLHRIYPVKEKEPKKNNSRFGCWGKKKKRKGFQLWRRTHYKQKHFWQK